MKIITVEQALPKLRIGDTVLLNISYLKDLLRRKKSQPTSDRENNIRTRYAKGHQNTAEEALREYESGSQGPIELGLIGMVNHFPAY